MRRSLEVISEQSVPWRERPLLSLQTASEIIGVSVASLYRFENEKRLVFRRLGGRTLVVTPSLVALIDAAEPWAASTLTSKAVAARAEATARAAQR